MISYLMFSCFYIHFLLDGFLVLMQASLSRDAKNSYEHFRSQTYYVLTLNSYMFFAGS